jgi:hypothetical protein
MSISYIQNATGKVIHSTSTIPSSTMTTTYTNSSIKTSTFCDGWPRVLGQTETPVTLTFPDASVCKFLYEIPTRRLNILNLTCLQMITSKEVFPGPKPTCTIANTQCNFAWSAYDSSTFSYLSSAYFSFFVSKKTGLPPNIYFGTLAPPCASVSSCPTPTSTISCSLEAEQATVFYWPASTTGPSCGKETAIKLTPTLAGKPNTAVFHNVTVTSPSALVVLRSLAAAVTTIDTKKSSEELQRGYTVPPIYTRCGLEIDATFAVRTESLSSLRNSYSPTIIQGAYTQYTTSKIPYPFDFADLSPENVPYEAYAAAKGCNRQTRSDPHCPKTILDDYLPSFALPKEAAGAGAGNDFAGCSAGGLIEHAVYIPITASTVEVPSTTHYGAMVTVGPRFSSLQPAALVRIMTAEVTAMPGLDL